MQFFRGEAYSTRYSCARRTPTRGWLIVATISYSASLQEPGAARRLIPAFAAIGPRLDEAIAGADGSEEIDALHLHHLLHQRLLAERAGELRLA